MSMAVSTCAGCEVRRLCRPSVPLGEPENAPMEPFPERSSAVGDSATVPLIAEQTGRHGRETLVPGRTVWR